LRKGEKKEGSLFQRGRSDEKKEKDNYALA
jgi:hypothetical protein